MLSPSFPFGSTLCVSLKHTLTVCTLPEVSTHIHTTVRVSLWLHMAEPHRVDGGAGILVVDMESLQENIVS